MDKSEVEASSEVVEELANHYEVTQPWAEHDIAVLREAAEIMMAYVEFGE